MKFELEVKTAKEGWKNAKSYHYTSTYDLHLAAKAVLAKLAKGTEVGCTVWSGSNQYLKSFFYKEGKGFYGTSDNVSLTDWLKVCDRA